VKYTQDLQAHWSQLESAFEAATRWAQAHCATFRVITERDILVLAVRGIEDFHTDG
jgi:hypothetical protein